MLWGKSKENRITPCGEMNVNDGAQDDRSAQGEKDERTNQEKGERKHYDKESVISPAEQV